MHIYLYYKQPKKMAVKSG